MPHDCAAQATRPGGSQFTLIHIFSMAINLATKSGILTRCVLRVLTIDCLHIYPSLITVTLTSLC